MRWWSVPPTADRPTKKDGLVDAVYLPSLFLVTFCPRLLLSPTESTGHDDDEIHFLCRHRVLPSLLPTKELPAKSTQHEPKGVGGSLEVGETHAGVDGINLIYAS